MAAQKLKEKQHESQDKRNKVNEHYQELELKSVQDYKKTVAASKRKMKIDLGGDYLKVTERRAREVLQAKADQIERMNQTFQAEDRTNRIETIRTLETVQAKVDYHHEKAKIYKASVGQKFSKDCERIMYQGQRHKEDQEKMQLEKQGDLLDKLTKRRKALENY